MSQIPNVKADGPDRIVVPASELERRRRERDKRRQPFEGSILEGADEREASASR